jgi:acylphosphatase
VSGDQARVEATVRGRVQGVGFRYFVMRRATRLGLRGWVANEPDGSVRCVAEGPGESIEAFLGSLRAGPPGARVDGVDVVRGTATGDLDGFRVRATGHSGD